MGYMDNQLTYPRPAASTVNTIIIGIVVLLGVFLMMLRVDRYIKVKAIDECAKISKYEKTVTAENAKVSYPLADVYQSCLKDKGIK